VFPLLRKFYSIIALSAISVTGRFETIGLQELKGKIGVLANDFYSTTMTQVEFM